MREGDNERLNEESLLIAMKKLLHRGRYEH